MIPSMRQAQVFQEGYDAGRNDIAMGVTREEATADSIDDIVSNMYDDGADAELSPAEMREWAIGYKAAYDVERAR